MAGSNRCVAWYAAGNDGEPVWEGAGTISPKHQALLDGKVVPHATPSQCGLPGHVQAGNLRGQEGEGGLSVQLIARQEIDAAPQALQPTALRQTRHLLRV